MPSAPGLAPEVSSAVNAGVLSSPNTSSEAKRLIAQEAAKKLNRTDTKDIRHAEHGKRGNIWILSGLRKLGQEQVVDRVTGGQARRRSEATLYIKWYEGRHGRIPTVDEVRNGLSGADTVNHKLYTDNLRSRTQKEITAERHQSWKNAVSKDRIQVRNAAQVMQGGEMGAAVNRIVEEATKSGSLSPTQREALSRALSTGTAAERLRAQGVTAEDFVAGIEGMAARSQRDKIKVERATVSVQQHVEEALQSRIGKLANKVGKATIDKLVKIAESKLGKFLSKGSLAIAIGVIALHFIPPLGIAADILTIAGVGFSSMNAILTIGRVVGKARSLSGAIEFASAGNERFYMGGKSRHFIENSRGRKLQRKAQSHMHSVQHEYYDIYNKYFDADGNLLPNINPDNEAVQKDLLLLKARYDAANKFQADNTRKAWRHDTLSSQRSTPKELEKKVNEAERNLQSANARVGEFLKADTQQIEEAINRQLQKLNEELAQDKRIERRIVTNRVLFQVLLRAGGMGLAANEAATFASNLIQTHSVTDAVTGLHNPLETFGQYSQIGKLQTGISHLQADFQPHDAINYAMSSVDAHAANGITSTNTVDMHSSGVINPNDISRVSAMQELHGGTQISPDQWKTIQQALSDNPHGGGGVDSLKAAIDEAYKNGQGGPGGVSENALRHILEELSHGHNPPTGDELAKELQQAASHGGGDVKGLTPDQIMKLLHDHHVVPTMHNEAAQAGARFVNEQHTSTDVLGKVPATDTSSTQNIPPAGVPQIPTAGAPQIPTDTNQSGFDEVMHGVQKSWSEFAQNPGKTITDDFRSVFHLGPDANHAGVVGVGHNENVNVIDQFHHHTGTLETHANAGNMYGHDHFSIPTNHPEDASDRLLGTWQGAHTAYDPNGKWVEFYGTYPHAQMEINIDGHYYTFQPGTMTLGSHDMLTLHPLDGGHDITMSQDNFLHMVGYGDQKSILAGYIINHDTQVWGQQHGWTLTHNASDRIAQYLNGQLGARHAGLDAMIQRDLTAHGISNGDIHYTAVPMGEALQNGHHITILAQNQYIDSAAFRGNVVEYIPGADSASDGAYQWLMYGAGIASTVAAIVGFGAGRSHNRATRFPFITQGPHPVLSDAYLGGTAALAAASFFVPPLALISGPALAGYIAGRISARHAQAPAQNNAHGNNNNNNNPPGPTNAPANNTTPPTNTPTGTPPAGNTNPRPPGAPAFTGGVATPQAVRNQMQAAMTATGRGANRQVNRFAQAAGIPANQANGILRAGSTAGRLGMGGLTGDSLDIARGRAGVNAMIALPAHERMDMTQLAQRKYAELLAIGMNVPESQVGAVADQIQRTARVHLAREQVLANNPGATIQAQADAMIEALRADETAISGTPDPEQNPRMALRHILTVLPELPGAGSEIRQALRNQSYGVEARAVAASHLASPAGGPLSLEAQRAQAAFDEADVFANPTAVDSDAVARIIRALNEAYMGFPSLVLGTRATRERGIQEAVDAQAPGNMPLRVRVAAEAADGNRDAQMNAAFAYYRRARTVGGVAQPPRLQDRFGILREFTQMGFSASEARNGFRRDGSPFTNADNAVMAALAEDPARSNTERMQAGLAALPQPPTRTATEVVDALLGMRDVLTNVQDDELRDAVNSLRLNRAERANSARSALNELAGRVGTPEIPTMADAIRIAIAMSGIQPIQTGQVVDMDTARDITALGIQLLGYNRSPVLGRLIPDIPRALRDNLGLNSDSLPVVAEAIVERPATDVPQALGRIFSIVISPNATPGEIAQVMEAVKNSPNLPATGRDLTSLGDMMGAGRLNISGLGRRAVIYSDFLEIPGGSNPSEQTLNALNRGITSDRDNLDVVQALVLTNQPNDDIRNAMRTRIVAAALPTVARLAEIRNRAALAARVGTDEGERMQLAILTTAPDATFDEMDTLVSTLEAQSGGNKVNMQVIRSAVNQLGFTDAQRRALITADMAQQAAATGTRIRALTGSNRKTVISEVSSEIMRALAIAGYDEWSSLSPTEQGTIRGIISAAFVGGTKKITQSVIDKAFDTVS